MTDYPVAKIGDLVAGDLVTVERTNRHSGNTVTYETELFAPYPHQSEVLEDGLGFTVREWRGRQAGDVITIRMVKKAPTPNYFYKNMDRPPVVGDVYINTDNMPAVIRRTNVNSHAGLIQSGTIDWALQENKNPLSGNKRVLIFDAFKRVPVAYIPEVEW